jgi:hypothetical protein
MAKPKTSTRSKASLVKNGSKVPVKALPVTLLSGFLVCHGCRGCSEKY